MREVIPRQEQCRRSARTGPGTTIPEELARRSAPSSVTALLAAMLFLICLPLAAERPPSPPYYAVSDVRVVIGNGDVLELATVLIADGLIEAVGPDLEIPADARVIDGSGLTLYPGLIDGMGHLGMPAATEDDDTSGPGPGGPPAAAQPQGPEARPGTTPWLRAVDQVTDSGRFESWRQAGFTAAASVPREGFFSGQAAILALGDGDGSDLVVAADVAMGVGFEAKGGFRTFPGSLMGAISYVKQVLLDARHGITARALYEASPNGRQRPAYDRSLEPIAHALEGQMPFLLPGNFGREIDRVLELARQHDLRAMIYGGQGAYDRIEALKAAGTPVLVSLDWPEAEKDRDPDAATPLRTLVHYRLAPTTPSRLQAAGIPFAFASQGLNSPSEVFEGVRKAIEAGLAPQDALGALTLGAARIYGIDDRLGSIETGKAAHLVLATAEPWVEDVEIRAVWVDGALFLERQEDKDVEPPAGDVSGTWAMILETPRGNRDIEAVLTMGEDGKVSGELKSEEGEPSTLDKGRLSGDRLTFETTRSMGSREVQVSYSLLLAGERLEGTVSAGPMVMDFKGERTAQAAATEEDGAAEVEVSVEELRQALRQLQGPVEKMDRFAIFNARVYTLDGDTPAGIIENGTVIVADGKIEAVGESLSLPDGLPTIDAAGGSLIPGIIDAHSHITIEGGGNEGTVAVSSMVTVAEVIDPDDIAIYRALAGGVTTINVLHGSSNPIGGGNAVLKLRWGQDADGMFFVGAPPGIKFALGENPKRSRMPAGFPQRYPATRMGVMDVIRQAFTEAAAYRQAWQDYDAAKKAKKNPIPPRRDRRLEPLVEILDGERLVHAHSYRADEILQLLRLAEELGFRIATLQHVLEGYRVADEIAAHGAGASTFSDWWGYKAEAYEAIPYNAALMHERGVLVSINSDSAEEMRHLNLEAAKMMKWGGLDELEALALVTLNPAKQLQIDGRVGSIEVGKDADLVLYDGPPLSVRSVVQKTFVDGDLYFDRQADRQRQSTLEALRDKLEPKKPKDGEAAEQTGEPAAGSEPSSGGTWKHMDYSCQEDLR